MTDASRIQQKQTVMNSISVRIAVLVTVATFGILTALFVEGILTPRGFGIAGLLVIFGFAAIWYLMIRASARSNDAGGSPRESTNKTGRGLYFRVAVILALLIFSAWETRGGPWLPRLVGASILILFLIGTVRASR